MIGSFLGSTENGPEYMVTGTGPIRFNRGAIRDPGATASIQDSLAIGRDTEMEKP